MAIKRRVSKAIHNLITPEACELFRRGLELQAIGADEIDCDDSEAAEEYLALSKRLHWTLLGCVADAGPLDVTDDDQPADDETSAGTYRASIPHAIELRRLLMIEIRR